MTAGQRNINAALERFGGHFDLAATVLGITKHSLECAVSKCEELRLRWTKTPNVKEAPTATETLHRPQIVIDDEPQLTANEKQLVVGMAQEDALLAEGLERLGLTPEEAGIAFQLQQFHKKQFVKSIEILGGSMTRVCLKMQTQLEKVSERLEQIRTEMKRENIGAITRAALSDEEYKLYRVWIEMADQIRMMFDTSQRAAMLQAMITYRMSGRNAKQVMTKPGFQPFIAVNGSNEDIPQQTNQRAK